MLDIPGWACSGLPAVIVDSPVGCSPLLRSLGVHSRLDTWALISLSLASGSSSE